MMDGVVETEAGRVRGMRDGRAWSWRGLPYATPPVGALRFRRPVPPKTWDGLRDGSRFGAVALQRVPRVGAARLGPTPSEDCLTLNIWSPAMDGRRRPVMVWVHGGAYVSGTGALYGGASLATLGDIVVMTLNYRLGVFGFVNLGDALGDAGVDGNLGLHDAIAALHWVRRNISAFGGDPERVTLAGESAGSVIVSLLMTVAAARPLFAQAILQSGASNLVHSRTRSQQVAETYLAHLGGPRDLAALQALPAATLLEAQRAVAKRLDGIAPAAPWFDGTLLPADFEAARNVRPPPIPLLAGANRDEIVLFKLLPGPKILRTTRMRVLECVDRDLDPTIARKLRRAYPDTRVGNRALASDANFIMPTLHAAERHASTGGPTWVYRFDYAHPLLRASHALELLFLWPFPGIVGALLRGGFLTGLRSGLSERMRAAWTTFVRTGAPGEDWPRFTVPTRTTRLLALQDRIVDDPMRDRREAWSGQDMEAGS